MTQIKQSPKTTTSIPSSSTWTSPLQGCHIYLVSESCSRLAMLNEYKKTHLQDFSWETRLIWQPCLSVRTVVCGSTRHIMFSPVSDSPPRSSHRPMGTLSWGHSISYNHPILCLLPTPWRPPGTHGPGRAPSLELRKPTPLATVFYLGKVKHNNNVTCSWKKRQYVLYICIRRHCILIYSLLCIIRIFFSQKHTKVPCNFSM